MTDESDDSRAVDEEITKAYRNLATERVPATVNESVMRRARAVQDRGYARLTYWLRPLAWAATIGLSLAVVLQLADIPDPESAAPVPRPGSAQSLPEDKAESPPLENRAASTARASDPAQTREALMRVKDSTVPQAVPARSQKFVASEIAEASTCTAEQVASPETWLDCILALEDDDRQEAAASERRRLAATFPEFQPTRN